MRGNHLEGSCSSTTVRPQRQLIRRHWKREKEKRGDGERHRRPAQRRCGAPRHSGLVILERIFPPKAGFAATPEFRRSALGIVGGTPDLSSVHPAGEGSFTAAVRKCMPRPRSKLSAPHWGSRTSTGPRQVAGGAGNFERNGNRSSGGRRVRLDPAGRPIKCPRQVHQISMPRCCRWRGAGSDSTTRDRGRLETGVTIMRTWRRCFDNRPHARD